MTANALEHVYLLEPGDARRPAIGRAVGLSFLAAVAFVGSAFATKEIRSLYAVAPWRDDPYDLFVSFAIFFVPMILGVNAVRVERCRRADRLSAQRVSDVVRAFIVIAVVSLSTIGAAWVSVAVGPPTGASLTVQALEFGLVINTILTATATVVLIWVVRDVSRPPDRREGDDFLADLAFEARRLARAIQGNGAIVRFVDASASRLPPVVRRNRYRTIAALSVLFGASLAAVAALDQDPPVLLVLICCIGSAGMSGFAVLADAYLGLIRPASPSVTRPRFLVPGSVAALAVPVAVAYRDDLWWIVGTTADRAGPTQLAALLAIATVGAGAASIAVLAVLRYARRGDEAPPIDQPPIGS